MSTPKLAAFVRRRRQSGAALIDYPVIAMIIAAAVVMALWGEKLAPVSAATTHAPTAVDSGSSDGPDRDRPRG